MSDTPRTDAAVKAMVDKGMDLTFPTNVAISVARQLEKELAAARGANCLNRRPEKYWLSKVQDRRGSTPTSMALSQELSMQSGEATHGHIFPLSSSTLR